MSQTLGTKQMYFLCLVFSVFTLTGTFFYTNLIHNNVKGELLSNLHHSVGLLSNSTSTSISKNLKTLSRIFASTFPNHSVHSSQSTRNQTTVKTSAGDESENLRGFNKSNENANTKVKTAKQAEKADAPTNILDRLKSPSRQKLLDFPSSEKVVPTLDPLYNHHGFLSVLDHKKKLNLHCIQCAFVSSSGQLLNSSAGYLIDEADCVFRMNNAPSSGYEEDVGYRTTVRVISHVSTSHLKKNHHSLVGNPSPPEYVVGWGPAKPLSLDGKGYAYNILRDVAKKYEQTEFFHITQKQMNKSDEIFEAETGVPRMTSGTHLSTGWFTMMLARAVCDEIHIYGMVNDRHCQVTTNQNVPYHYYEQSGRKECDYYNKNEKGKKNVHRFITEKAIFARWALEQPPMYFHNPFWDP